MTQDDGAPTSRGRILTSTIPAVLILLGVIVYGTAEMGHGRLLALGESWYPGYFNLRIDPEEPTCNPDDYVFVPQTAPAVGAEEEDLLDDLFEDDEPEAKPAPAKSAPAEDDDALLDDLLDEDDEEGGTKSDAEHAALHAKAEAARKSSLRKARVNCELKHTNFTERVAQITPAVRRFRQIETGIADFVKVAVSHQRHGLVLLLLICAITVTLIRGHIALRPARTLMGHRMGEMGQLVANGLLLSSAWAYRQVDLHSGATVSHPEIHWIWIAGFAGLVLANVANLVRIPKGIERGSLAKGLLCVPLYAIMAVTAGLYFLLKEDYAAGLAIYLTKLTEHAIIYIHVGLYVWIGMLLKRTRLADLAFAVIRPWKLTPELLVIVVVIGAALPTAFSGASGIFVIAAGAVIYDELRRSGARRQLALAATAMSGSMGVVLAPCLLVVIVASLNKQVTTDELYMWGNKVFLLTAVLLAIGVLLTRQNKLKMAPPKTAIKGSLKAARALIPYVVFTVAVISFDAGVLGVYVDEHSGPIILPVILLTILALDRILAHRAGESEPRFRRSIELATTETTGHIGALLMLMAMSICLGGIVERADLMSMVPQTFGSVWITMSVLVVVLVVVGMTMDPYGAVILVSATISEVAYSNGINAVHFWMVVLVAFELGYLTPPVALNHLLTRQVISDDEALAAEAEGGSFWRRHERILLPISVMGTALLIVAYGPLLLS